MSKRVCPAVLQNFVSIDVSRVLSFFDQILLLYGRMVRVGALYTSVLEDCWTKFILKLLLNPLNTNRRPLYLKTQFLPAVNTFHLGYKNQSVYGVSGTSRCFSQINTKHINTVWAERRVVEC